MTTMILPLPKGGAIPKDFKVPMPENLALGHRQLLEIWTAIWQQGLDPIQECNELQIFIESLIQEKAAEEGIEFRTLLLTLGSIKLAVDMITNSMDRFLGPFAHPDMFVSAPEVVYTTEREAVIRFKTKAYVEKNSQPTGGVADQGPGSGESGQ